MDEITKGIGIRVDGVGDVDSESKMHGLQEIEIDEKQGFGEHLRDRNEIGHISISISIFVNNFKSDTFCGDMRLEQNTKIAG